MNNEMNHTQIIKPVQNSLAASEVLKEVSIGSPVYLTKNGRGEFAIVDMKELDELKAVKGLFSALEKGEISAREKGWISADDAEIALGL